VTVSTVKIGAVVAALSSQLKGISIYTLTTMGTGSFPGAKRPGRGVDHYPHIAPELKKEYIYISTPPLDLHGLL